ncbi:MAG: c-type cytochrome [Planctomycetes bacterium]|nr:c-type cytochrome [Planctomycetota bacterium]
MRTLPLLASVLLALPLAAQTPTQAPAPAPASTPLPANAAQTQLSSPVNAAQRWGADYFPNLLLTNQDGEKLRFFDDMLKDKVVVINFIYTSCPDACPLETARLIEVYDLLKDWVGKDIFFYSISIDPDIDTPAVLKEYSKRFKTGPGWQFLTGSKADIRTVREKLGMIRSDEQSLSDHTLSLMVGNQRIGRWLKRSPMENPFMLANTLGTWINKSAVRLTPMQDYKDAPTKLRPMSKGEELYRTRCNACHLLGEEDGLLRNGPPLLGIVDRRDPAWLRRWIAEPDAMLAEKDPLAMELYEQWSRVPMPNLRLEQKEVDAILGYMKSESDYLAAERAKRAEEERASAQAESDAYDMSYEKDASAASGERKLPCCEKRNDLVIDRFGSSDEQSSSQPGTTGDSSSAPRAPAVGKRHNEPARNSGGGVLLGMGLALVLGVLHLSRRN